jgi:hypothetical protein
MGHIIQIEDNREDAALRGRCSCGATRAKQDFLSKELRDLKSEYRRRSILRLEDLQYSFSPGVRTRNPQWDYIYSSGLLATLPHAAAKQVVRKATSSLKPGGRLLFANVTFKPGENRCDTCASQQRVHRTEYDMADLAQAVPDRLVSGQAVFRDPSGLNVYLELYRS